MSSEVARKLVCVHYDVAFLSMFNGGVFDMGMGT
jgi:hypothetical protein